MAVIIRQTVCDTGYSSVFKGNVGDQWFGSNFKAITQEIVVYKVTFIGINVTDGLYEISLVQRLQSAAHFFRGKVSAGAVRQRFYSQDLTIRIRVVELQNDVCVLTINKGRDISAGLVFASFVPAVKLIVGNHMLVKRQPGIVEFTDEIQVIVKIIEIVETEVDECTSGINKHIEFYILYRIPFFICQDQYLLSFFVFGERKWYVRKGDLFFMQRIKRRLLSGIV